MAIERRIKRTELSIAIGVALAIGNVHAGLPPEFDLSSVNGTNGTVFNGAAPDDYAGKSVSAAGDINGDGFDDLLIGAPYTSNVANSAGTAYVVFGGSQPPPSPLDLSSLDANSGLVVTGVDANAFVGYSVSGAGDINGDGIDDLIVGAPTYAGAAFVVFGSDQPLPASLSVGSLDGSNGFAIEGEFSYSNTGTSVSAAGDINGDGIDDLIVGAPFSGAGFAYVVFGSDQGWAASLELSGLNGSNGFRIDGAEAGDSLGISVGRAGDVNGDGMEDVVVGASLAGVEGAYSGIGYVIFGDNTGFAHPLDVSDLDGSDGFAIVGLTQGDELGNSVSTAGDVNGDDIDDLIFGAPGTNPNGGDSGATYVVFGSDQGWSASLNVSSLNGSNGFVLNGVGAGDRSGTSVSLAGDMNQDGFDDVIIGAPFASPSGASSGAAYVVHGSDQAWPASISLAGLNGVTGFRIDGVGAGDEAGTSVTDAGDFNNDGVADFALGAPKDDPNGAQSGAAFVVYDTADDEDLIFDDGFEEP